MRDLIVLQLFHFSFTIVIIIIINIITFFFLSILHLLKELILMMMVMVVMVVMMVMSVLSFAPLKYFLSHIRKEHSQYKRTNNLKYPDASYSTETLSKYCIL